MSRNNLDEAIRGALARGYTTPENAKKILDPELLEAMAKELKSVILEFIKDLCEPMEEPDTEGNVGVMAIYQGRNHLRKELLELAKEKLK